MFGLFGIGSMLLRLIDVYSFLIVAEAILSWVPTTPGSVLYDIRGALRTLTDPFIDIFRRMMPSSTTGGMGIDFSPVIAIIVLQLIENLIVRILW